MKDWSSACMYDLALDVLDVVSEAEDFDDLDVVVAKFAFDDLDGRLKSMRSG